MRKVVFWCFLLGMLIGAPFVGCSFPYDDTDAPPMRSGLRLFTDHGTGCQYVGYGSGVSPRLGPDGKPMCGRAAR